MKKLINAIKNLFKKTKTYKYPKFLEERAKHIKNLISGK